MIRKYKRQFVSYSCSLSPSHCWQAGLHIVQVLVGVQEGTRGWVRAVCLEACGKQAVNEPVLFARTQDTTSWLFTRQLCYLGSKGNILFTVAWKQKATRKMEKEVLLYVYLIETI